MHESIQQYYNMAPPEPSGPTKGRPGYPNTKEAGENGHNITL